MLKKHLRSALTHLWWRKSTSLVSVLGLGVGLGAVILILLFVEQQLSFEFFFPDAERIYKVELTGERPGGETSKSATSPIFHKIILDEVGAPVEAAARLGLLRQVVHAAGDAEASFETVSYVDPELLEIFALDYITGDGASALRDASSLVISASMARKYFGRTDVLGETLTLDNADDMRVAAVFRDLPSQTHLDLGLLAPYDRDKLSGWPLLAGHWGAQQFHTYMKLAPGAAPSDIAAQVSELEKKYFPAVSMGGRDYGPGEFFDARFVPLLDLHFDSAYPDGDRIVVFGFAGVAGLILLIAIINFVNLSIARSTQYAREVSIRRVFGAGRRSIMGQFLTESVLTAFLGLAVGVVLAEASLPFFNRLLDAELSFATVDLTTTGLLLGLTLLTGLIGGAYPALIIANFRPGMILRTNRSEARSTLRIRNILVLLQFAASIALIIGAAVVYRQIDFARSADLGYEHAGQILLQGLDREDVRDRIDLLRQRMTAIPGVAAAAASLNAPGEGLVNNDGARVQTDQGEVEITVGSLAADPEFFDVYGIEPAAGRLLERDRPLDDLARVRAADGAALGAFLLTEKAVRELGFASPEDALGRRMTLRNAEGILVGILPDINFYNARFATQALAVYFQTGFAQVMSLRIETPEMARVLRDIDAAWAEIFPNTPIQRQFLDDQLRELYEAERVQGALFLSFAVLAILLACLGLYSLAAFAVERRRDEISIRKVFGARIRDILGLQLWQFTKPVLLANLIAWPVAAYAMHRWLEGFAFRIELTLWPFLLAGAAALAIALLTVSGHALRVARTHPALALREE